MDTLQRRRSTIDEAKEAERRDLVGQMSEEVGRVEIEIEDGETQISPMVEDEQRTDVADQHVTTNVEFASLDQQGIGNVSEERPMGGEGREDRDEPLNDSFHGVDLR